jgi:general secretion pathway protein N
VADTLRPASLLIGAICLWAVSVLLLALFGLGTRVADSGLVASAPPIPQVTLAQTRSRLGPLIDYAQVGQRPLLMPDRRAPPAMAAAGATDQLDVVLTSVLITPGLQMAILTDAKDQSNRRVRVGENVAGTNWRLASLEPRRAVLDGPSGQRTLVLRVYDGKGGEAPTTVAGATQASDATPGTLRGEGDAGTRNAAASGATPAAAGVRPPVTAVAAPPPPTPVPSMQPQPTTQDAQIEAIRRRIEARRAQMRAEAQAAGSQNR